MRAVYPDELISLLCNRQMNIHTYLIVSMIRGKRGMRFIEEISELLMVIFVNLA